MQESRLKRILSSLALFCADTNVSAPETLNHKIHTRTSRHPKSPELRIEAEPLWLSWTSKRLLLYLIGFRQVDQAAMPVLLDVVPHELVLQPRSLSLGKLRVLARCLMTDFEPLPAIAALDHVHHHSGAGRRVLTAPADTSRRSLDVAGLLYQRGSLGWRACPR